MTLPDAILAAHLVARRTPDICANGREASGALARLVFAFMVFGLGAAALDAKVGRDVAPTDIISKR
jgi:hypothetical protein